jgi:hypothetical protein
MSIRLLYLIVHRIEHRRIQTVASRNESTVCEKLAEDLRETLVGEACLQFIGAAAPPTAPSESQYLRDYSDRSQRLPCLILSVCAG